MISSSIWRRQERSGGCCRCRSGHWQQCRWGLYVLLFYGLQKDALHKVLGSIVAATSSLEPAVQEDNVAAFSTLLKCYMCTGGRKLLDTTSSENNFGLGSFGNGFGNLNGFTGSHDSTTTTPDNRVQMPTTQNGFQGTSMMPTNLPTGAAYSY